jgi:hypothetical protein
MEQTIKPFDNIGIAFSGGGFRAASFALGTLSYLHHLGLDRQISFSSSASAGVLPIYYIRLTGMRVKALMTFTGNWKGAKRVGCAGKGTG